MDRRDLLKFASACALAGSASMSAAAIKGKRILFVHGRAQQGRMATVLKSEWVAALSRGAQSLGRSLPDLIDVAFPYYGDTLDKFTRQFEIPLALDIRTRGEKVSPIFWPFKLKWRRPCANARALPTSRSIRNMDPTQGREASKLGMGPRNIGCDRQVCRR